MPFVSPIQQPCTEGEVCAVTFLWFSMGTEIFYNLLNMQWEMHLKQARVKITIITDISLFTILWEELYTEGVQLTYCSATGFTTVHRPRVSMFDSSSRIAPSVSRWIQWPAVSSGGRVWRCWMDSCYEIFSSRFQLIAGHWHHRHVYVCTPVNVLGQQQFTTTVCRDIYKWGLGEQSDKIWEVWSKFFLSKGRGISVLSLKYGNFMSCFPIWTVLNLISAGGGHHHRLHWGSSQYSRASLAVRSEREWRNGRRREVGWVRIGKDGRGD